MVNYLVFGGVSSADYGIYISGEALFDAPKREVETVAIPGRNGDLLIDHKRFENIEVSYPAFCYNKTYTEFIENIDNFRNAIASQTSYQRLTDTFHPDEFRMATFINGIEINPILYNSGATFTITFTCKPQRFLTSGEIPQIFNAAGTILNPTLFESLPLIKVTGDGTVTFVSPEHPRNAEVGIVFKV